MSNDSKNEAWPKILDLAVKKYVEIGKLKINGYLPSDHYDCDNAFRLPDDLTKRQWRTVMRLICKKTLPYRDSQTSNTIRVKNDHYIGFLPESVNITVHEEVGFILAEPIGITHRCAPANALVEPNALNRYDPEIAVQNKLRAEHIAIGMEERIQRLNINTEEARLIVEFVKKLRGAKA